MKQTCLCRSTQGLGQGVALLALRLFAAYEFGEAGLEKWRGENWFADIREAFPFPFDLLPAGLSWNLAMGAELLVPLLLQGAGRFSLDALLARRRQAADKP